MSLNARPASLLYPKWRNQIYLYRTIFLGKWKLFIYTSSWCLSLSCFLLKWERSEWEKKFCPFLAKMSHIHVIEINCSQTSLSFLAWNLILILFFREFNVIETFLICSVYYFICCNLLIWLNLKNNHTLLKI